MRHSTISLLLCIGCLLNAKAASAQKVKHVRKQAKTSMQHVMKPRAVQKTAATTQQPVNAAGVEETVPQQASFTLPMEKQKKVVIVPAPPPPPGRDVVPRR